jgi:DNA-binding CsgD family transcriptional regulator
MIIGAIKGNAKDGGYDLPGNIHIKKKELDALILVSRGLSNSEAAEKLGVSLNTFRNHVYNIMKKLGANNRANALLIAIEKGMLELVKEKVTKDDDYVLCWRCHRAYLPDETRVRHFKQIVIDHVKIEPPEEDICAYEDCNGKYREDTIEWSRVRKSNPGYPEIPERGKVYETKELPWYWIEAEKNYKGYLAELEERRKAKEKGKKEEEFIDLMDGNE